MGFHHHLKHILILTSWEMHWFLTFSVYECVLAIGGHSGSPDGWNSKGFSMLIQQPSTCSYTPVTLKPSPGPKSIQSFPIPVSSTHGSRPCDFPPPWLPQGNSRPGGYSHSSGFQRGQPPPPTVSSAGAAALWPLRTELPAPLVVSLSHCTSAFLWTGASTLQAERPWPRVPSSVYATKDRQTEP